MNLAGLETNYQEILFSDNPGQNCRDNSCFSPSPHYNVDFSRSPKSRSVHRSLACFNIVWGKGGRKKGSERRTNVAHITVETCTVNSLLFAQNLTSVPKCFDPDCSLHCSSAFLSVLQIVVRYSSIAVFRQWRLPVDFKTCRVF